MMHEIALFIDSHSDVISIIVTIVLSTLSTLQIKRYFDINRGFYNISTNRIDAINGKWAGSFVQEKSPDNDGKLILAIESSLTFKDGKILGEFSYHYKGMETKLICQGHAMDNNYIVLNYRDADKRTVRYGTFLIALSPLGKSLNGMFVAYAAELSGIVCGEISMEKR